MVLYLNKSTYRLIFSRGITLVFWTFLQLHNLYGRHRILRYLPERAAACRWWIFMDQGALGAAGVRRVWAEAGLRRTGAGAYCVDCLPTACFCVLTEMQELEIEEGTHLVCYVDNICRVVLWTFHLLTSALLVMRLWLEIHPVLSPVFHDNPVTEFWVLFRRTFCKRWWMGCRCQLDILGRAKLQQMQTLGFILQAGTFQRFRWHAGSAFSRSPEN